MCIGSVFRIECLAIVIDSSDEQQFYSNNAQWLLRRFRVWEMQCRKPGIPRNIYDPASVTPAKIS